MFTFLTKVSFGQEEIRFSDGSLNAILSIAKDRNKNVFIDTYADWCQPCKRMEKKFKDKDVAKFFNEHFINYRVNMQHDVKANQLRKRYDIVFMPTMLIVDPNGVVKYQVDRELSVSELLNMGQTALGSYHISESTPIRKNSNDVVLAPKSTERTVEKTTKPETTLKNTTSTVSTSPATERAKILDSYETVDESSQKVLAVLGVGELPPEILMQEAYLRLEFMDGSHKQAARNYLATQENWDTEANRKFVLDFVSNASSPEYDFIVANKEKYNNQFGAASIKKTLEIITYRALHNAVPRPSLAEAIQLYKNLDVKEPNRQGYHYFLARLIVENNINEVLQLSDEYLTTSSQDHEFQYTVARFLTNRSDSSEDDLVKASNLMKTASEIKPESLIYLDLLGKIYTDLGKSNSAKRTYLKAIQEAKKQGKDSKSFEDKSMALNG